MSHVTNIVKVPGTLNTPHAYSWCKAWGVRVVGDDRLRLYKATDNWLTSGVDFGLPTRWWPGTEVVCHDWTPTPSCGGGLHLGPTPGMAFRYRTIMGLGIHETRLFLVEVALSDIVPIPMDYPYLGTWQRSRVDKCKVPRAKVLTEVDLDGRSLDEKWVDPYEGE